MKKGLADNINHTCLCKTLDRKVLEAELLKEDLDPRPHLFSSTMMFISQHDFESMARLIQIIEEVVGRPDYQKTVLTYAPKLASLNPGPRGVFMGYDFHITNAGIKLIEINTNAGGALLNAKLARAQHDCCIELPFETKFEEIFLSMFFTEWKLQRGAEPLRTIAIVDERPAEQYLYPEFKLFQKLFQTNGLEAWILDPSEISAREDGLYFSEKKIDLIYNRLTDFYFAMPSHLNIRNAFESGTVVVTPSPHHHAIYANKLNLEKIRNFPLPAEEAEILKAGIPETVKLEAAQAESFWERRKDLFFKPAAGFGSKASYRGDKITRKVWEQIIGEEYIAQAIVPPGSRVVDVSGKETGLKVDVRAYVYQGEIQILASRLYSGQTTNFRTAGGGFAPVFITPS